MEIENELEGTFRRFFHNPEIRLERSTTAFDIDGWDSLANINLILTIESDFKIKIHASEVIRFRNVGDLIDLIAKKRQVTS